jgi:hypothetical protein
MLLDVKKAPPSLLAPLKADVRLLTSVDSLSEVIQILESVWGGNFSWVTGRLGSHMQVPGYLSVYVAYVTVSPLAPDGLTLMEATLSPACGVVPPWKLTASAGCIPPSWLPAFRRPSAGCAYLTVDAGPMSRPILKTRLSDVDHEQDLLKP